MDWNDVTTQVLSATLAGILAGLAVPLILSLGTAFGWRERVPEATDSPVASEGPSASVGRDNNGIISVEDHRQYNTETNITKNITYSQNMSGSQPSGSTDDAWGQMILYVVVGLTALVLFLLSFRFVHAAIIGAAVGMGVALLYQVVRSIFVLRTWTLGSTVTCINIAGSIAVTIYAWSNLITTTRGKASVEKASSLMQPFPDVTTGTFTSKVATIFEYFFSETKVIVQTYSSSELGHLTAVMGAAALTGILLLQAFGMLRKWYIHSKYAMKVSPKPKYVRSAELFKKLKPWALGGPMLIGVIIFVMSNGLAWDFFTGIASGKI